MYAFVSVLNFFCVVTHINSTTTANLVLETFFIVWSSSTLSPFLSVKDVSRLSTTCTALLHFNTQMPILLVEGRDCAKLHTLNKYLKYTQKNKTKHIHARLAMDEVHDIDQHLNRDIHTLLLQPIAYNWSPYAVLKNVAWLEEFHELQHLEISLDGQSAPMFVELLRQQHTLPAIQALVVSTNQACHGLWSSLTAFNRRHLRVLCTNGFRLQDVPLHHLSNLRYLWISRPCTRHTSYLSRNIARDLPVLKYLTTSEFRGLGKDAELIQWMTCLSANVEFWELHDSDVTTQNVQILTQCLRQHQSRYPLTIQGLRMNDQCIRVAPYNHCLLSCLGRHIPLQKHRIYRSLDVLENVLHTKIPQPCGNFTTLKGKHV